MNRGKERGQDTAWAAQPEAQARVQMSREATSASRGASTASEHADTVIRGAGQQSEGEAEKRSRVEAAGLRIY